MRSVASEIDISRKFVRLIEKRPDGFVEFEFAIGDPELYVEMLLPSEAYSSFCEMNEVIFLAPRQAAGVREAGDWSWNLYQATHQRFR